MLPIRTATKPNIERVLLNKDQITTSAVHCCQEYFKMQFFSLSYRGRVNSDAC